MSQDSREHFGVKTLDQHWRVAGESDWGGGEREGRKDRKGMLRAR